ncbi:MAG: iron-sulfur cluster assembly accessory protein [Thermodesulfovibrio sp.]|nr:iron-sulfur cluster assembly accessory protein [Thermodesulfovibrio sp.]
MLKITDSAAEKAKEILKAEGKEGWGLRIFVQGSSCCGPSYGMDIDEKAADGDETVEKNGLKVFVNAETSASLTDKEIDYVANDRGEGFVINGGAAPSCGSGAGASSGCGSGCSSCD